MNKFLEKINEAKSILLLMLYFVLLFILTYKVYEHVFKFYVMVKFDEVAPITKSLNVYYKGFRVGKTTDIKPGADFKYTLVKIIFNSDVSILPNNITAKVKHQADETNRGTGKIYIEIIYPDSPSVNLIKRGDTINGKMEPDINSFMSSQVESGALNAISANMNKTLMSAEKTSDALRDLFNTINEMVLEMQPNLVASSKNLASTTRNLDAMSKDLSQMAAKLNQSVSSDEVSNILSNINESTNQIQVMTSNMKQISIDVNKATLNLEQTAANIDTTVVGIQETVTNVKNITGGICKLLGQRFPGMRLMFGKPFDKEDTQGCSCGK